MSTQITPNTSESFQPDLAVQVTPDAATEVRAALQGEGIPSATAGLRVAVTPGGCSGFRYTLTIEDAPAGDDAVVAQEGFRLFVDPFSAQYLNGTTIDYHRSLQGAGFTFTNPNAKGGCGCGKSFGA